MHRGRFFVPELIRLTQAETVPLLLALVSRVTEDNGIRALLIKGPMLEMQGLRPPRQSGDVDVWCDPARAGDLGQLLEGLGWRPLNAHPGSPEVIRRHSVTYAHSRWSCCIDFHVRFPGFYASDEQVFESLWERRTSVTIAAQPVTCCDLLGAAAIWALHELRTRGYQSSEMSLDFLTEVLSSKLDDHSRREFAELTLATGSTDTLATVIDRIGAPPLGRGLTSSANLADWDLRHKIVPGVPWLIEFRRRPLHHWPLIVWRILTVDAEAILSGDPGINRGVLAKGRLVARRGWSALRQFPTAMRQIVNMRRSQ